MDGIYSKSRFRWIALVACSLLIAGCASGTAVSSGSNAALDSDNLQQMTDKMAMEIASSPKVNRQIVQTGPLVIVCEPVENRMVGEVLPRGQAELYTARVRTLLSEKAPDRFTFVMNRDEYYDLRSRELDKVDLGPAPEHVSPQYVLHAQFDSITKEDEKHRDSYYLCVYRLTDLDNRTELWSGHYEVKKKVVKQFLD
jgi:hypothetical protein